MVGASRTQVCLCDASGVLLAASLPSIYSEKKLLYNVKGMVYNYLEGKRDNKMFHRYYGVPNDAKYGEKFMSRFPILFQDRKKSMQETCMCWGIECPKGWWHILDQLCTVLEFHNMEFVKNYGVAIVADQVKEKFGTLRFYYDVRPVDENGIVKYEPDELPTDKDRQRMIVMGYLEMLADQYIREAEDMTANTCARCGTPLEDGNRVETKGWITYLCKECDEKIRNGGSFDDDEEDADEEPAGEAGKAE